MERMVQALMWLSTVAVISGLLVLTMILANHGQLYPAGLFTAESGQQPGMLATLFNYWPVALNQTATYLTAGAALGGVALAWVEQRWNWMAAALAVITATIIFPAALNTLLANADFTAVHPRVSQHLAANATLMIFALEVAPPALALAYVLRHHRVSGAFTRDEADASLGISRSAL